MVGESGHVLSLRADSIPRRFSFAFRPLFPTVFLSLSSSISTSSPSSGLTTSFNVPINLSCLFSNPLFNDW